jgi:Rad3-related DNA helicase
MPRDALAGLAADVHARLAPGGTLQRAWPHFEDRVEQRALAVEIAELIERGGVLLAEAPTGLGKSLAYLLPAVLAVAGGERRVVVATATRSLQDQLVERDLPMVLSALGLSLRVARLKGKQNYLCPRALELAEGRGGEEDDAFDALRHWAATDPEGDLDRFDAPDAETFRRLRARVAADPDACTLPVCRRGRECFWVRARRQAGESPIVVVNHALLARAAQVDGLLPDYDILIVDEAHRLEGVLLAQLERSVSRNRFEELLRTTGAAGTGRGSGVLGRLRAFSRPTLERPETSGVASEDLDALARRSAECRADVETLFTLVEPQRVREGPYGTRARYRSAAELLGGDLEPLERVHEHCLAFARRLHQWGSVLDTGGASGAALELSAELDQASARWSAVASDLLELCEATSRGSVYWRSAGGRGVELHGAPISAGAYAREQVLARARAVVLTSATLTAGGDFAFTADRLGLGESWGAPYAGTSHRSPFALERQMRTFVLGDAKGDEAAAVSDVVAALAEATGRNQLVLFTAHERLRRARERLMGRLPKGHRCGRRNGTDR